MEILSLWAEVDGSWCQKDIGFFRKSFEFLTLAEILICQKKIGIVKLWKKTAVISIVW